MKKLKNKLHFCFVIFFLVFLALPVVARVPSQYMEVEESVKSFRKYKEVKNINTSVATVVELPLENEYLERYDFLVVDQETNKAEPYYFQQETYSNKIPVSLSVIPPVSSISRINDGNLSSYAQFDLPEDRQGQTKIIISSSRPISASSLNILLDKNVALPNTVEVRATVGGASKILLSNRKMTSQTIRFPKTISSHWEISFSYGQLLRISELNLIQEDLSKTKNRSIRWLAQVGHDYRVYLDPDVATNVYTGESANLRSDQDVLVLASTSSWPNSNYRSADVDGDGIKDTLDNCVSVANPDQLDTNRNGRGDTCDDFDKDGVMNYQDNCQNNPNRYQQDEDADGIGDVCDLEESRITEKHSWLPWLGIVFAVVVIVVLFFITAKTPKSED